LLFLEVLLPVIDIASIFAILNRLSIVECATVGLSHVVLVDLDFVAPGQITAAKAANLAHEVTAGPCKDLPLFFTFVGVGS